MSELEKLDYDLLRHVGSMDLIDDYRRLRTKWSRELCLELLAIMKRIKELEAEIKQIHEELAEL